MRLIEFCPGDGSRFLVGAAIPPVSDSRAVGGSDCTVFITFGNKNLMVSHVFECDPVGCPHLTWAYCAEKLTLLDPGSLDVAHHVIAHLLGREASFARLVPSEEGWDGDWMVRLDVLIAEIAGGLMWNGAGGAARALLAHPNRFRNTVPTTASTTAGSTEEVSLG